MEELKEITQENIIYVDETKVDRCLYREYARASQERKVVAKISGRKFKRMNTIVGIRQEKWAAPLEYTKTTDSILLEFWFENYLLKEVGTGSTIILDNASFHKKSVLASLAKSCNCEILFLSPYSPDLDPIEKKWVWLKRKLRGILHVFGSSDEAIWNVFQVSQLYSCKE